MAKEFGQRTIHEPYSNFETISLITFSLLLLRVVPKIFNTSLVLNEENDISYRTKLYCVKSNFISWTISPQLLEQKFMI